MHAPEILSAAREDHAADEFALSGKGRGID